MMEYLLLFDWHDVVLSVVIVVARLKFRPFKLLNKTNYGVKRARKRLEKK